MRVPVTLIPAALALTGCTSLLPAHPLSNDTDGERVTITMLDQAAMETKSKELGFPMPKQAQSFGGVAAAAAGFLIDTVKQRLDEEADLYETQFEAKKAFADFWSGAQPRYVGFCLDRWTSRAPEDAAFTLVCGLASDSDGKLITIQPLYLGEQRAKAKVLAFTASGWWSAAWIWAFKTGDKVDVDLSLEFGSAWLDQAGAFNSGKIAEASFSVPALDLGAKKVWQEGDQAIAGWMPGVPRSTDETGEGHFWIRAVVTERDPSNARKYLEKASHYLDTHRDSLIAHVTEDEGGTGAKSKATPIKREPPSGSAVQPTSTTPATTPK